MGSVSRLPWWRRPGRRERARALAALGRGRARGARRARLRRALGRPAPARAGRARARAGRRRRAARRAVHGRRRGQRRRALGAHRPPRGRGARRARSRRTTSTRRAASTACSASTAARSRSARPTCSRARCSRRPTAARSSRSTTARGPAGARHPARPPPRPRRRRMTGAWQWLSEPWGQAFMQHAFLEIALVGLVGGWLGCWVLLYGVSYSAESLAHGMFPGLVGASLLGLPIVAGGAVGAGAAAIGHRRPRRPARARPRHVRRRRDHVGVRAGRAARADARLAARHPGAAVRRRARRLAARPRSSPR